MIYESWPWKRSLLKNAVFLRDLAHRQRFSSQTYVRFEQTIFLSAYAIRKLIEAQKVSDRFRELVIDVETLPRLPVPISPLNDHKLDKLFDFSSVKPAQLKLTELLNQLIHSSIFFARAGEETVVDGFFVASDRWRETCLFSVNISNYCTILEDVGNNDPQAVRSWRDPNTGRWITEVD